MKKNVRAVSRILVLFVLVLPLCVLHGRTTARADFGDFTSDFDYDSGSYDSDSGGSGFGGGFLTYLLIVFFGGIALLTGGGRGSNSGRNKTHGDSFTPENLLTPIGEYRNLDPAFNETAFCDYLEKLYIRMQIAWHNRDLSDVGRDFTRDFFNRYDRELTNKRAGGEVPVTEEVEVRQVSARGYFQSGENDHILVMIRASLIAYYVNEKTGKLLSGDKKHKKLMTYEWDLVRPTGTMTADSWNWQLDSIKGISQQTLK